MTQTPIEQIEINLRSQALNLRKDALDELVSYPAEVAVPVLQKLAEEKDFGLRRLAVMGLGNHTSESSFQVLNTIIKQESDSNVLAEAANSIFDFGEIAIPVLEELFESSGNWLVCQTILSLFAESNYYDTSFKLAKSALKNEEIQTLRETAILTLGQLLKSPLKDQALSMLIELTKAPDWRTRWRSAIALQNTQDILAKETITKLQQDESHRVVAAALEVASSWENDSF